jgi:ATP-dependent Clp protease ATP-binding subunit ClpA
MEFRFQCFVVRHASGRVTVTPLELPHLAVHAASLEKATEELVLAIDDRITRAHPRRIVDYARPGGGRIIELDVDAIPVWDVEKTDTRTLRVTGIVAPAHKPYVEVRAPRLDTRLWIASGSLEPQAQELLREHLVRLPEPVILSQRREGAESLVEIVVEASPVRLATLKRGELSLEERPYRVEEKEEKEETTGDEDEEDTSSAADDDDWDDEASRKAKRKARAAGAKKKKKRVPTPTLKKIASPWHELAKDGALDPAYERDDVVALLATRIAAKAPEPILLVGPAGVGKTAILHELAQRLRRETETIEAAEKAGTPRPEPPPGEPDLFDRAFWFIDGSRLIAGEGFFGDWQRQTLDVFEEARKSHAVLALGHVIDLLDAGKSAYSEQNVAQLLLPVLAAREACVIGEATPEEWARLERRNQSFARVWSVVRIDEPAGDGTARILKRVGDAQGEAKGVTVEQHAIDETVALCRRFRPYGSLLGNSVAFLRRLVDGRGHALAETVRPIDAIDLFSSESGIPSVLLRDDLTLDPAEVRAFLGARVMGQDAAVRRVSEVIAVIKAGLSDLKRPIGVLFFAGPTGVGKTELSKALAEYVFGARDRLVRLDMGEYAGPDALARLIGDGGQPGHLTSAVRRQPFCVLLFDEIEKAHPAVFDALLGVLGEGRLTDSQGRFTDFRNAVIVMTSNLGADTWKSRMGFGGAAAGAPELRAHYVGEAEKFFRPELFNRIDDFVVFGALDEARLRAIVGREIGLVKKRAGFRRHDAGLVVEDNALDLLAKSGHDPRYGARPLKRAIERMLVVPVASYLAAHAKENVGATKLIASAEGDAIALAAESVGGDEEGVSRHAIVEVLERAQTVRADIRRWSRSRPMASLRQQVAFFDKASKQPAFWAERALAEESSRRAAEARELTVAFADSERQAEAAEDLVFEAFYERSVSAAWTLRAEIEETAKKVEPMKERLYATLFPPRDKVTLYVCPSKGAWSWVIWLVKSYQAWAEAREVTMTTSVAMYVEPKTRKAAPPPKPEPPRTNKKHAPDKPPPVPAATKKKEKDKEDRGDKDAWKWTVRAPLEEDAPTPAAVALHFSGGKQLMLLAAEHGVHRFSDTGSTSIVKVRFEPESRLLRALPDIPELDKSLPDAEIRRIWPRKQGGPGTVRDTRTQTDHKCDLEKCDLGPVFDAYMRWRIFSTGDD